MPAKRSRTGHAGTQRRGRQASRPDGDAYADLVAACQADLEEIVGLCADLGGAPPAGRWGGSRRLARAVARSLLGEDPRASSPIRDAIAEHVAWQRTELAPEDQTGVDQPGSGKNGGVGMHVSTGLAAVGDAGGPSAANLLPANEAVDIVLRGTPIPRPEHPRARATSSTSAADFASRAPLVPTGSAAAGTTLPSDGACLDTWEVLSTRGDQPDPLDLGVAFVWLVVRIAGLALLAVGVWLIWQEGSQAFAWLRR